MTDNYLVTICTITYNQQEYIEDALKSILMQKTNFPFQVIISDDCSTDNTAQIIKKYEKMYPDKIKAFYNNQNIGAHQNYIFCLSQAKSKYLVVNEGDDYFLDPYKLQKQVDFLEKNPDYSICFHPVKIIYENSKKIRTYPKNTLFNHNFNFKTLLEHNFIQTNSAMYRWGFCDTNIKEVFPRDILPGDWYLHLLHAKTGKIKMLKSKMSAYRKHSGGIWFEKFKGQNNLVYGTKIINFHKAVWENITDKSEEYLNKVFLPVFKNISDIYYLNGNIDKLIELKNTFNDLFDKSLKTLTKKEIKRKKIFKYILISFIITFVLLILSLFFLFSTIF